MTEVLPSQVHLGSYTPDQSESEDYVNALHYVSDTDTDGYSGNPASPLVAAISIRELCKDPGTPVSQSSSSLGSSVTRGRWGEVGSRASSLTRRTGSFNRTNHHDVEDRERSAQLSLVALLLATVRRSVLTMCQAVEEGDEPQLDIGWPTDVQHVAHVTFDRYNGFLGLPQEFQVEVPGRVPSASQSVFGVSAESMQCSYDHNGNSVPTILLLMQERLYHQGGLKAEGIFRINAENSHHEHVRDQLNKGVVPMDIDLHCLAGLIKAWFRELPQGVLDVLSPEQVLECHTEEETVALVKLLPPTQAALLDWAVNLMADVVQEEVANKMNARNIAMVFAPNMTQMADPLTALMHAVQVMNLLKTLILRTLKHRQDALLEQAESLTRPETSEGDEPDSDCNNVLLNGHERHSSEPEEATKVDYDQYSHRVVIPTKRPSKVKPKSGNLGCMVEATESERRRRLSHSLGLLYTSYHCRPLWSLPLRFLKLSRSSSSSGCKALRKFRVPSRSKSSPQLHLRPLHGALLPPLVPSSDEELADGRIEKEVMKKTFNIFLASGALPLRV